MPIFSGLSRWLSWRSRGQRVVSLDVYRAEWTFYKVQAAALESCGMDEQLLPLGRNQAFLMLARID